MTQSQRRNLFLFTGGRFISFIGSAIQMIAVPLYILDSTGSGTMMGLFTVLSMGPLLIISPLAGVLGDRLNRKKIAVYADCGRGGIILFLSWLALVGKINITNLFIGQVFISLLDSLFNAATAAMLPDLVCGDDLSRVNAIRGVVDGGSMVIGPVLGGTIYGLCGIKTVFFVNAVSFIFSAACESFIRYQVLTEAVPQFTFRSFKNEISEIIFYVLNHAGLWQLSLFAMVNNFLVGPVLLVVMPFLLKKVIGFSSAQYGYLMAFFTLGLITGNILIGTRFAKSDTGKLMKLGLLVTGLFFVLFAPLVFPKAIEYFTPYQWIYFFLTGTSFMIAGIFNALSNTPVTTNFQKMVPAHLRARFFSVFAMSVQLAVPLGAGIFGVLVDKVPVHYLILSVGLLLLAGTIWFIGAANAEVFNPNPLSREIRKSIQ